MVRQSLYAHEQKKRERETEPHVALPLSGDFEKERFDLSICVFGERIVKKRNKTDFYVRSLWFSISPSK